MPSATLLLREKAVVSLATIVERSQDRNPPFLEYDLHLNATHLDLVLKTEPNSPDEGFESDIDSLSSFTNETKTETDSGHGVDAADLEHPPPRLSPQESHNLVDCVCYSDVKSPNILVFAIKDEALVFKFDNLNNLKNFYLNFTALKAVSNQKTYSKTSTKFNLLQRTDSNGVTHIEITREPEVFTLVSTPKRPDRRKKAKAPQPPLDVFRGEYVRVNVNTDAIKEHKFVAKSQLKEKTPPKIETWTNSVPRLLKKPRSKSETRILTPMAYRYIDATPIYAPSLENRFFGLSPQIRDFAPKPQNRWKSVSELSCKSEGNLKSVIKKEEGKKKEKKVTFSAYTTVQVV